MRRYVRLQSSETDGEVVMSFGLCHTRSAAKILSH